VRPALIPRAPSAPSIGSAEVDHREPVAIDRFLRALKNARGVRQDESTADRRRRIWTIEPAEPKRIAKAQAAVAPKVSDLQRSVLQRFAPEPDFSTPQLLRATAHDAAPPGPGAQAARLAQRSMGS
jgi:hypothetical protein